MKIDTVTSVRLQRARRYVAELLGNDSANAAGDVMRWHDHHTPKDWKDKPGGRAVAASLPPYLERVMAGERYPHAGAKGFADINEDWKDKSHGPAVAVGLPPYLERILSAEKNPTAMVKGFTKKDIDWNDK